MKDTMAIETTAAGGSALVKIFGASVVAGAVASAFAFMFMWPRTLTEAAIRLASTLLASFVAGPVLVIAVHSSSPGLFESARTVAAMYGAMPDLGFLFVAAPLMVVAGLPAWWVIGWIVRWMDARRNKDIGEVAQDAAAAVKRVREAL
jgi:hypothetical protein